MTEQGIAENYAMLLEDAVRETKPEALFHWKRMFGGAAYYVDEQIFAAWFGGGQITLKLSEADASELKKLGGLAAPETMAKHYTHVPASIESNEEALAVWVAKSMAYVASLPKKKKKKK